MTSARLASGRAWSTTAATEASAPSSRRATTAGRSCATRSRSSSAVSPVSMEDVEAMWEAAAADSDGRASMASSFCRPLRRREASISPAQKPTASPPASAASENAHPEAACGRSPFDGIGDGARSGDSWRPPSSFTCTAPAPKSVWPLSLTTRTCCREAPDVVAHSAMAAMASPLRYAPSRTPRITSADADFALSAKGDSMAGRTRTRARATSRNDEMASVTRPSRSLVAAFRSDE